MANNVQERAPIRNAANVELAATARPGRAVITGRVLSGMAIVLLAMDAGGKLVAPEVMIAHSLADQIPTDPAVYRMLGTILAICVALYAWPKAAPLGAVLLTGYLGGAVAIQLRAGNPIVTHVLSGVYIGALVWLGLLIRRPDVARAFAIGSSGRRT